MSEVTRFHFVLYSPMGEIPCVYRMIHASLHSVGVFQKKFYVSKICSYEVLEDIERRIMAMKQAYQQYIVCDIYGVYLSSFL